MQSSSWTVVLAAAAVLSIVANGWLLRAWWTLRSRADALAEAAGRVSGAEAHRVLPTGGDDGLSRLAHAFNQLSEQLRTARLQQEPDRAFDRAMVNATPNGLLIVDAAGLVRRYNPSLARILPVVGDPVGTPPLEHIAVPELAEVIVESMRTRAITERPGTWNGRDLLFRGIPLADGGGCMGVVLDVTSIRDAERSRRDFVANVSHELKTPVTSVLGYAESMLDEDISPTVRTMAEAIARNARRLSALVADVLDLSRVEARRHDLELTRQPLKPVVEDVLDRFGDAASRAGVELVATIPPDLSLTTDADTLGHALGNLVENAVRYTPKGGHVRIVAEGAGPRVHVRVIDDGIGIDAAHHARIFERFYRVDPSRSRDAGGTGLGLALVKHLCASIRAEVTFTSALGKGSTFTITLPA